MSGSWSLKNNVINMELTFENKAKSCFTFVSRPDPA